jgi:hypothetical protein
MPVTYHLEAYLVLTAHSATGSFKPGRLRTAMCHVRPVRL